MDGSASAYVKERIRVRQAFFRRNRKYRYEYKPFDKPRYRMDWLVRDYTKWHDMESESNEPDRDIFAITFPAIRKSLQRDQSD